MALGKAEMLGMTQAETTKVAPYDPNVLKQWAG